MIESAAKCLQPMTQAAGAYPQPRVVSGGPTSETRGAGDAVELSETAQRHTKDASARPIRQNLVQRVRSELADGTYLTGEKLDAVVNRLHRALFAE